MNKRNLLSLVTALAIVLIVYFARHDIAIAWGLIERVDIWLLLLLIPVQFLSYYAVGAIIFDYLRSKGELKDTNRWSMARIALELNFVNHALPSGGVSGISYLNWRLKKLGVGLGRTTAAQLIRFVATFAAFLVLLLVALFFLALDGSINRFTLLFSSAMVTAIVFGSLMLVYIVGSETRIKAFSRSCFRGLRWFACKVMRRKTAFVDEERIEEFFMEMHRDYVELKADPRALKKSFIWALIFNIAEVSMFLLAFAALGSSVNPAALLIAYGLACIAGFIVITPGGAGAYEAIMIFFLGSAGVPSGIAIAGILLARVILLLGTILSGYIFYQLALMKYGKQPSLSN